MPAQSLIARSFTRITICALMTCLLLRSPAPGKGVPGSEAAVAGQENASKGKYLGADYCAQCHQNGPVAGRSNDYVLLTEYKTWAEKDKHAKAYKVLTEPRSKLIGALMGIPDLTKDTRCLNCHCANVPKNQREEAEGLAYRTEDGVSCDACHGPSSNWIVPHSLPAWRTKPMPDKEVLGMNDVRDPEKRSRLCFSCHIGSFGEGKLVTHEMYAAGHPPLPSIEIATFSDSMPRHWRYMNEKKPKILALLKYNRKELERTKLTVIGGTVALEASLSLLANQVDLAKSNADQDKSWPELALFDCYACHHELRVPSWRQARGYTGKPGRPQFRPWPTALIPLGIDQSRREGERAAYQQKERTLAAAFNVRPFGDPAEIATAARALQDWCRQLNDKRNRDPTSFDEPAARRLLLDLCALAGTAKPDYDSARQLAWAFRVIYGDLKPKPANDSAIQDKLKALDQVLKLDLPAGQERQILADLPSTLSKIADFDPAGCKKLFGELAELLPRN